MQAAIIPGYTKIIGIAGGMGPEAGLSLFNSILAHTPAGTDQEHIPVVLISFPGQITDRTAFLEGKTDINPAYSVAAVIRKLELAGANVAGIACNTIYAPRIFDVLLQELDRLKCRVKLLHMPMETCHYLKTHYPYAKRIGVLSTNGTYRSGIYRDLLERQGYEVIMPDAEFQHEVVHRMIYDRQFGMKANPGNISSESKALMARAVSLLKKQQAEVIILGCTELPMMLAGKRSVEGITILSSVEAMALALIREAAVTLKPQDTPAF